LTFTSTPAIDVALAAGLPVGDGFVAVKFEPIKVASDPGLQVLSKARLAMLKIPVVADLAAETLMVTR
jgi:hypothetical protein